MQFLGLARTPRRIADLLASSAASAASAGKELSALGRGLDGQDELTSAVADTRRLVHETVLETGDMFGGGIDRSDVLAMALSVKEVADAIEEAAAALGHAPAHAAPWEPVTAVIRDSVRALAAAIERLDGPRRKRDARLDRVEALHEEGRGLMRSARARLLGGSAEVLGVVAAEEALRRLERALRACARCGRVVRRVVVKHA